MNKFINETLVIYISKFTNTKVIKALKDGMMFSLPFLMIGSLFLLIANLPIESVSKVISESGIGDVCSQVYSSTFSLMAFFTVIGITYSYLKNDQVITAINGALTGLAAFILLTPSSKVLDSGESVTGIISKDWTAGQGMICAILIGFLVGYIYSLCVKKDISIKMPDGVPSGVADSFSSLLPTGIIITICAIVGAILALNGHFALTIGTLVAFLTLNKSFNQPIGQISQQINAVAMAQAGAGRIFDLLDQESEDDQGVVTLCRVETVDGKMVETDKRTGHWAWKHPRSDGHVELVEMKGDIRLEGVDFGYFDDRMVLHNVDVYANPGEKIAFVGATGAGKTTITNLINRFYDIQKGSITYDGIDIKLIKKDDLRRSLGVVLQDTHLFTGTVMDNIRYGRLDATDEECIEAAKLANADLFVKHLPDGYQTMLTGDGANLSQGQRQLLAIARAAVANPPALILDEATSSIDSRTEKLVQDGMDKLMHGRTTLVIAHRLSTIKNSDCIMVLEQGHIIERGNHQSLIKEKGKYYQLYTGAIEMD